MNDLYELPQGWEWEKLSLFLNENPKSKIKVKEADNIGTMPFFTSGQNILRHSLNLVDDINIFMSTGGIASIKIYNGKASYSTDTFSYKVKKCNIYYFYYYILNNIQFINKELFKGVGLKHLQKKDFKNQYIPPSTTFRTTTHCSKTR